VAGAAFTLADIVFLYSVDLGATVAKQLFGLDLLGDMPAAQSLLQKLNENPHVRDIAAKRDAAMPAFIAAASARFQTSG
jgi:glutathione S-transferase